MNSFEPDSFENTPPPSLLNTRTFLFLVCFSFLLSGSLYGYQYYQTRHQRAMQAEKRKMEEKRQQELFRQKQAKEQRIQRFSLGELLACLDSPKAETRQEGLSGLRSKKDFHILPILRTRLAREMDSHFAQELQKLIQELEALQALEKK
jgi:hypothetical protein